MADYILPFLNEAMDSFVVKMYVLRSKEIIKGSFNFFIGSKVLSRKEPLKGLEEGKI